MSNPDPAALDNARALLKQLWSKHKDAIFERVSALETASRDAVALDPKAREEARSVAHKLAGLLGTFGFAEGSDLARDSELIFEAGKLTQAERERLVANAHKIRELLERGNRTYCVCKTRSRLSPAS